MTETPKTRDLVATLRDALQAMEAELGLMRGRASRRLTPKRRACGRHPAPGALRQEEAAAVGIDMVIDAATELLQAVTNLESALPDAQADMEMLEAEMEDDEDMTPDDASADSPDRRRSTTSLA